MIRKFQLLLWHFKEEKILFGLPLEIPIEITTKPKGSGLLKYFWVNLLVQNVFTGSCLVMKGEYQTRVLPPWDGWLTLVLSHSFDSHQPTVRIAATSDLAIHGNAREVCGSDLLIDLLCIILRSGCKEKGLMGALRHELCMTPRSPPFWSGKIVFPQFRCTLKNYLIPSHIIRFKKNNWYITLHQIFSKIFTKKNPYAFCNFMLIYSFCLPKFFFFILGSPKAYFLAPS